MIYISVSKAAKMLGITRKNIQKDIFEGILETHEGLVTLDSIRRAYPTKALDLDYQRNLDNAEEIKNNAALNIGKKQIIEKENERYLKQKILSLNKTVSLLRKENDILREKLEEK
jgi:CDP-4-dehydro-6-deoxyglucose reductase